MSGSFEGKVALRSWMQSCKFIAQSMERKHKRANDYLQTFDARVYEVDVNDVLALESVCGKSRDGEECPPFAPFDNVYVGFTGGIDVRNRSKLESLGVDIVSACATGLTIRSDFAAVWIDVFGYMDEDATYSSVPLWLYRSGEWCDDSVIGVDVALGVCQMLHASQHKRSVTPGLVAEAKRRAWKNRRVVPRPYYVIHPGSHYCVPRVRRKLGRRNGHGLAYRHDRMAHERVLTQRGDGILSAADMETLVERGYRVYDDSNPTIPAPDLHRLISREHRMRRTGEWLAIKNVNVSACVVGSEDLPYVPAVRSMK